MGRPKNPYGYFEYVGRRITLTQTYIQRKFGFGLIIKAEPFREALTFFL
jgi:hypothetical protein